MQPGAQTAFDGRLYPHSADGLIRCWGLKTEGEAAPFKEERGKGLGAGVLGIWRPPFLGLKLFLLSWPSACRGSQEQG